MPYISGTQCIIAAVFLFLVVRWLLQPLPPHRKEKKSAPLYPQNYEAIYPHSPMTYHQEVDAFCELDEQEETWGMHH